MFINKEMLTLFFLKLTYVSKKKNGVKIEPITWPEGRLPIYVSGVGVTKKKIQESTCQ